METNTKGILDDQQLQDLLEKMEASNAEQAKYARKQTFAARVTMAVSLIVCAVVLYAAITILPQVSNTFRDLDIIVANLKSVSTELAEVDFTQLNTLLSEGSGGIEDAVTKLESLDIDTLNNAIKNLNDTVTPMAEFFQRFK